MADQRKTEIKSSFDRAVVPGIERRFLHLEDRHVHQNVIFQRMGNQDQKDRRQFYI
jgi:hypothetical protein